MKKDAIIFDLDGTLATKCNRKFFEWDKVISDLPKPIIISLLKDLQKVGHTIIIMTGRDAECKTETVEWLAKYDIEYEEIFMRAHKDNRPDSVVKKELYETYVQPHYDILFVVDDRNQVVDMWRKELGITCLQCEYGDF